LGGWNRGVARWHICMGCWAPIDRKNGWQLAEVAGDRTPDGVQDFLARRRWEADLVREDLRAYSGLPIDVQDIHNERTRPAHRQE
jgi:hypothetical protein